jgi:Fur family transcriptional regulator, ferric uptake regulator
MAVLETLLSSHEHMSSADVLAEAQARHPELGRASVFRSLDLLTRVGIVRPTYIESSGTPRYVVLPDGHHHHVICTQCNRIFEIHRCNMGPLIQDLEAEYGVTITGHLVEFYALCADCRSEPSSD